MTEGFGVIPPHPGLRSPAVSPKSYDVFGCHVATPSRLLLSVQDLLSRVAVAR